MSTPGMWGAVRVGAVVIGADGYEWLVTSRDNDGTVTMSREGRDPVTGRPPAGAPVTIVGQPDPFGVPSEARRLAPAAPPESGATRTAVAALREVIDVEVVECGWCKSTERPADDDCVCESHCGIGWCVNFRRALAA